MQQLEALLVLKATWETIYIVFISSTISIMLGAGLGILLFLTRQKQALANAKVNRTLGLIVNIARSVPFIILMISILPLTRLIVGTTIGTNAAIVPLTLAAIPFFARVCENALSEVPYGLIETANAMGANTNQLIFKILIPESLPSLIRGITLTVIALIGYSTMAGAVGGGGLGELAINYGYQRFDVIVTLETVVVLIFLVQIVQYTGDYLAVKRQFKPILVTAAILALTCIATQIYPLIVKHNEELKVGVTSGWPEEVMKVAQKVALEQYHLNIKVIPFNDYVLPNTALANGNIDANIFQHLPYLNEQIKSRHYPLTPIAKTFVYPMGFYSQKLDTIASLRHNAIIAIPNDPINEARSLLLLQKAGIISLKPLTKDALPSARDIASNPKQLQIKLLDAAQLPRALKDADLVALTNDYVGPAGFTIQQSLLKEGPDSAYANIIVGRIDENNDDRLKTLAEVMHSKEVLDATVKIFPNGAAIPAWG